MDIFIVCKLYLKKKNNLGACLTSNRAVPCPLPSLGKEKGLPWLVVASGKSATAVIAPPAALPTCGLLKSVMVIRIRKLSKPR